MKKLSTYSSSHTLHFPKVPQKLQKCQSIIISPSDTSEKIQAREPARPPSPRSRRVPCQPRRGRGRTWTRQQPRCQLWAPAALAMTATASDSRGPQGCGGCGAHSATPGTLGSWVIPGAHTGVALWPGGWRRVTTPLPAAYSLRARGIWGMWPGSQC